MCCGLREMNSEKNRTQGFTCGPLWAVTVALYGRLPMAPFGRLRWQHMAGYGGPLWVVTVDYYGVITDTRQNPFEIRAASRGV